MITKRTIADLIERLEQTVNNPSSPANKAWAKETENLVYDVRNDLDNDNYGFEDFVTKEEYEDLKKENDDLHDEIIELEDKISDFED